VPARQHRRGGKKSGDVGFDEKKSKKKPGKKSDLSTERREAVPGRLCF